MVRWAISSASDGRRGLFLFLLLEAVFGIELGAELDLLLKEDEQEEDAGEEDGGLPDEPEGVHVAADDLRGGEGRKSRLSGRWRTGRSDRRRAESWCWGRRSGRRDAQSGC